MSVPEVIDMALGMPRLFLQMAYDAELTASRERESYGKPAWRKPGETAARARDRLRAEREEAKRRVRGR